MRSQFKKIAQNFVFAAVILSAGECLAESRSRDAVLCENAIVRGAQVTGIPQQVLHAISLTETGRREGGRLRPTPWAINREGQGFWFATRAEALEFARKSLAEGRKSFDVGCFQINYRWHGHNFQSLEQMFEPDAGARYASGFLKDLYAETGNWSRAAGAYHSRTPQYASKYRARFDRIIAGLGGNQMIAAAVPKSAVTVSGRSRTKMSRGPLIIRMEKKDAQPEQGDPLNKRMANLEAKRTSKVLQVRSKKLPARKSSPVREDEI